MNGGNVANSAPATPSNKISSPAKPTNTDAMAAKNTTTATASPSAASRTIATTNTDGMVVFSLQDLNAELLGRVAGANNSSASSFSRASSAGQNNKFRYRRHTSTHQSSSHTNDTTTMNADSNTSSTSDEENSGTGTGGGTSFQPIAKSNLTKKSRNSATYRPSASGRRSNNLRPHPSKYLPPFLQNGGGTSKVSGSKGSNSNSNSSSSVQSLASYNKNHRHHHRAPPPIKTAIWFEEKDGSYAQHLTATTAGSSSATSTTMMSSPPPSSSGRRSSNGSNGSASGRYQQQQQRTPHTMNNNDRHADIPDANVFGAITFASTPEEDEDEVNNNNGKARRGSRKARFAGASNLPMSGGGSHRGRGAGNSTTANGKKQQYRKTPYWKKKVEGATFTDASNNEVNNSNDGGMQSYHPYYYQGDYDYETGLISTDQNGNGGEWYSPVPASQYNFDYGEEYRHQPPQAPPTDDVEGTGNTNGKMMTAMMPNAALDYIHSARAEVASLTSPNVRALSAMAKSWDSSSFKSPTSSAAASASKSATPLSTGGTSYGSSSNDFQVLSPKSDLTSNATNTPSTGGTRSSGGSGSGGANRSPFVSPTTEKLASWASGASPTSSSIASALEKSLLSPGSTLSASVTAARGGSTRASSDGRVVRTPGGSIEIGSSGGIVPSGGGFNVLSSPGNAGTTIVQSAGGSIGDVSQYLLSSSGSAAVNLSPADHASPSAVDKTDAAICFGGGGSARGVLSPTTTIASEDAFTPSLRAEESGHEIGTDTTKSPDNDKGIKTRKVDATTSTHDSGTPSGIPKMVEARTQTEDITADQDPTKEISSSISSTIVAKLSSMKMDATPKGQSQARAIKTAMSATATEFTPSSLTKVSTTTGHAYALTASSTPAPILSATTQLAYIPTEINGVIHYVPTHVVLPASSPYSYTQHYPLQTAAGSVGASIAAESGPAAGARPRKPCLITSPATNDARAESTVKTMNALAREFEPSPPKKDDE